MTSGQNSSSMLICNVRCHQERVLMILPILSGCFSIIGSSLILYIIATHTTSAHTQRRQGRLQRGGASKLTYERILIGLTCSDFINSLQSITGSFTVPIGTPGFWYASGTQATCSAQGFLTVVANSTAYYSTALAIYFVLSMLPSVSDDTIKHRIEPFLHGISITVPVFFAIVGLVLKQYNPSPTVDMCSFGVYPIGCDNAEIPCTRGHHVKSVSDLVMTFGSILFTTIVACMITIYMLAWLQHRKMKSLYSVIASGTSTEYNTSTRNTISTAGGSSLQTSFFSRPSVINTESSGNHRMSIFQRNAIAEQQEQDRERQNGNNRKLRRIATQGLLYISAYIITWVWTITLIFLYQKDKQGWYSILISDNAIPVAVFTIKVFQRIFYPLQGMMNFFIYIRPRFIDLRAKSSYTISRYETIRTIIFNNCSTSPQVGTIRIDSKKLQQQPQQRLQQQQEEQEQEEEGRILSQNSLPSFDRGLVHFAQPIESISKTEAKLDYQADGISTTSMTTEVDVFNNIEENSMQRMQ